MVKKVSLRIAGKDLFDETVEETLMDVLDDAAIVEQRGRTQVLSFFVDDDQVVEAAVEIARKIEQRLPGAKVVGVDRDPVSITDISQRVGVSRETVRKWTLHAGFPEADGFIESSSMEFWSWVKIADWLITEREIDMEEQLPSHAQVTQIEHNIARNPDAIDLQWHNVKSKSTPVVEKSDYFILSSYQTTAPAEGDRGQLTVVA